MSDRVGLLSLPVAVPSVADGTAKTQACGDPALVVLASFLAKVLQEDCGAAWSAIDHAKEDIPDVRNLGIPRRTAVRGVHFFNPVPQQGQGAVPPAFVVADAPLLFVFRGTDRAAHQRFTADLDRRSGVITAIWLAHPAEAGEREERAAFRNALGAAVANSLRIGCHSAWVVADDLEKPATVIQSTPTLTADHTYSGVELDGALATTALDIPRCALVRTAAATGAYIVGTEIPIVGTDEKGRETSDSVTITNANGGEDLHTIFPYALIEEVTVPAQATTTGHISVGYWKSPHARTGSRIERAAGFSKIVLARPEETKVVIFGEGKSYEIVEFTFAVEEDILHDTAVHSFTPSDPALDGAVYQDPPGFISPMQL